MNVRMLSGAAFPLDSNNSSFLLIVGSVLKGTDQISAAATAPFACPGRSCMAYVCHSVVDLIVIMIISKRYLRDRELL